MDNTYLEEESSSGGGFNMQRYFSKIGKNYFWFLLSVPLFLGAAYVYLRYTVPVYSVAGMVLLETPSSAASKLGGSAFGTKNEVDWIDVNNEVVKFKSTDLIGKVVDSLKLNIEIRKINKIKKQVVSLDALPVNINYSRPKSASDNVAFDLKLDKNNYRVDFEEKSLTGTYIKPLLIGTDTLNITLKEGAIIEDDINYELDILSRQKAISKQMKNVEALPAPKAGYGMLQITYTNEVPDRAKQFIPVLMHNFDIMNLEYNNQAIRSEMNFLNERLAQVSDELDSQAKKVRDFKTGNRIFDVSSSANQLLGSLPEIDAKKTDFLLRQDLLNLVERNIKGYSGQEEIVPNSNGLNDPVLSSQIGKYNELVLQKRIVLENGTSQDPRLQSIDGQLQELRGNILKNVNNIKGEIRANFNSLSSQERTITGRFSAIPDKEREMIELNRVLGIKQSLYTFLLQKREDKNMELASAEIANSRIIDSGAGSISKFPNDKMIYLIALSIGILLPAMIILLRLLLVKKIETRQDVESLTKLPIAGEIGNVRKRDGIEMVITPDNVSPEAEQFRTLRTNISYLTRGVTHKTLLVTSSISEEGKSFISLNLANSIAISNKKVVLLEFDLRNPGLTDKLRLDESIGISNYLTGDAELEDIIQPIKESENLFFISSGNPIPRNAGELILSKRMDAMFDYLKKNFDVIVIDTPPVGPVSDALALGKWADISFFVVRHKHTLRSTIKLINKLSEDKKLPRMTLIINGIQDNKEFHYGNDFGYGYGYQADNKKKNKAIANN